MDAHANLNIASLSSRIWAADNILLQFQYLGAYM